MMSYRFRRRSFLAGLGGAFGLELMLENLEASAAGTPSPPRFLVTHWPNGTLRTQFVPTGTGTSYVASPLLQPFEDAGLRAETIALFGMNHNGITTNGGGSEGGTVITMTGAASPGVRDNAGEDDDSIAGGPSWDQIFLKNVPGLARRDANGTILGPGFANAICDSRVDSYEISTQCLSYGYQKRTIASARPLGMIDENNPLMPELSPLRLYARLFSAFMPGGNPEAALRALRMRKSVLDSALRELDRISTLAPASERPKIDAHADAIRKLELDLQRQIDAGGGGAACDVPPAPAETLIGKMGLQNFDSNNPMATEGDDAMHEAVGRAHFGIIRAAFQCDLIRVATFQWAPGTGHVALTGLDPANPTTAYHYTAVRYRQSSAAYYASPRPATEPLVWDVFNSVYLWYNRRMAELIASFKTTTDVFGNSLLSHTVIPYITEMAHPASARTPLPALVFGGSALGMQGGQFQDVGSRSQNDMWMSVGQAYLGASVLESLANEVFLKTNVTPIPGLWVAPV
ncbi:MAG TPA: DUF1552 domain-containing protein [Polyangiaceae bacterium]|nr:DUF1552 domain-containing protein [Polyangiaceae bacterium]